MPQYSGDARVDGTPADIKVGWSVEYPYTYLSLLKFIILSQIKHFAKCGC